MKYKVVKLAFSQGVHLGNGMLTDGGNTVFADTLFSALCQEALQMEGSVEGLCDLVRRNQLRFSDGMPYIGEKLYIPKPYLSVKTEEEGDSSLKKAFKKLTYIPVEKVEQYLSGKLDAAAENTVLSGLGSYEMRNHAAINRGKDSDPYHVGVYHFNPGCGLYLVIGYETEEIWSYAEQLLTALSYTGIGG
ncbi:MAG: type III-A CRISPR-associated RAMP protein Csm4, partial [Lachnospiraceae bacterium]|nr:type III-A CRISPR-associated RAMP protein Csm4 [Lachnospiraceae bacterium]